MIKNNLNQRIFTSMILLFLLFLMLKYSVVLISSLLLIFVVSWIEFNNLIEKIYKKNTSHFQKKIFQFFIFIYLLFFIKVVVDDYIQNQPNISWNILYVITICVLSDVGGYIFGKTFKGKKLTKISPNKTFSGMYGSFILSSLFALFYSYTISFVDFEVIFLISIFISIINQIGDLFVSYLKRKSKVKDTGNILPGHGGFLDRIDGILFALPVGILLFNYYF